MSTGVTKKHTMGLRTATIVALACVYIFWGGTYLGMKYAIESIPPFLMAGARFMLAGGILYGIMRLRGASRPTALQWRNGAIVGGLLLLGGNGVVAFAEQVVPSSIASLLIGMVPLWITGINYLLDRRKPTVGALGGIVLGLIGIAVLVWQPSNASDQPMLHIPGIIAIILASISWATGTVASKRIDLPRQPLLSTGIQMLCGGAMLLVVALLHGDLRGFQIASVTPTSWAALGYLVVFGSLIGFTAYIWLFKNADPFIASTYAYVNPIVALFLGWLIAGEQIGLNAIIAAIIIISSVVMITVFRQNTPAGSTAMQEGEPVSLEDGTAT